MTEFFRKDHLRWVRTVPEAELGDSLKIRLIKHLDRINALFSSTAFAFLASIFTQIARDEDIFLFGLALC